MEVKYKNGKGLVVAVVILVILLVCTIGTTIHFYLKSNGKTGKETVVADKADKNLNIDKGDDNLNTEDVVVKNGFDNSKSLNTTGKSYTLMGSYADRGINLSFDTTKKKMSVNLSACKFNSAYGLGWVTASGEFCADAYENRGEVTFAQEVSDFMIGGFGQSAVNDTMLFLMQDGTIEYIPIRKAYSSNAPENVKSYGAISGIGAVIKLYQVSAGSYVTVLAQKADGSFYDLNESLSTINAWS